MIAVDAFRRSGTPSGDRRSGTGGYSLLVDLLIPIATDPNGADGREALGLPQDPSIAVDAFRVLPGDDASCLNLYRPQNPRVLGVPQPFIAAGRFAFQRSLAATDAERANPWLLLARDFGPNVVPVIADANSMTYVLHRSLGEDIVVSHGAGSVRYRIVAALADSIFQREVLMSAANFGRLFPEQEGYRFLLVDTPREGAAAVASAIERQASDLGADAVDTAARLDDFHAVENTYLATFQALGGLGLLVGTIGLAAVVLRNVLERRRELALLGAVGYRRSHLLVLVLSENLLLLGVGIGRGRCLRARRNRARRPGTRRTGSSYGHSGAAAECGVRRRAAIVFYRHACGASHAAARGASLGVIHTVGGVHAAVCDYPHLPGRRIERAVG